MTGLQRGWHILTAVVVTVAVTGQLVSSVSQGLSALNFFSYFTIQSNLLVLATALALLCGCDSQARWFRVLRLAALTGITLTFVVYAVMIGPHITLSGADWWFDKGLHYAAPALALGGLVVGPRTRWGWPDLAFIAWPALWLMYTLGRAAAFNPAYTMPDLTTARVPYDFLDVERVGAATLVVTVVAITAVLLGIASAYVAVSRRAATQSAAA